MSIYTSKEDLIELREQEEAVRIKMKTAQARFLLYEEQWKHLRKEGKRLFKKLEAKL